ncbi:hypothetical protein TNCV_4768311 [Trichonephila clavipes]|nr:hypothetical protein TNCV_4768311 [Trichonephila clavipes]
MFFGNFRVLGELWTAEDIPPLTSDQSEKLIVFLEKESSPEYIEESINAALIEEQNMKLNQIASEERSGLSSAQTENPVLSALADRLQEINLRVGRLQEASAVTARKSGGNYSNRRERFQVLLLWYSRTQTGGM